MLSSIKTSNKGTRKAYIILSYTGTFYSRFLRIVLASRFVHTSIALDDKFREVYSFGRKYPRLMFPSGFVREDFNELAKVFKNSICQIYEMDLDEEKYEDLREIINKYIKEKDKYHYNIIGLVPLNFNIKFRRRCHYVCSQFVGKVIQDAGVYDLHKDFSLIKPKDINDMTILKKVYEGKIADIGECM